MKLIAGPVKVNAFGVHTSWYIIATSPQTDLAIQNQRQHLKLVTQSPTKLQNQTNLQQFPIKIISGYANVPQ